MAKSQTILSLDIDRFCIKALELEKRIQGWEIIDFAIKEIPNGKRTM